MNHTSLIAIASFHPKSLSAPNAWVGHLPFAAWLVSEMRPKNFVELGTHTGNSYFSVCQAVKFAGIDSRCFAVDTWAGDEHAGRYGEEIFKKVDSYNKENYSSFSTLLRMTFDEALESFSDGSVDLLHVDGLHTYEAVRHDFETWLPKLSPGAIILFHDTNVRDKNFGVWRLWKELQVIYPNNIEFFHSHGLGVLQLNNPPDGRSVKWLLPDCPEKKMLNGYFESLGNYQINRFRVNELQGALLMRDERISELSGEILTANQEIEVRGQEILRMRASLSWRLTAPLRRFRALFSKIL